MNVTIVTPSFNQGEFIERTIQSVQRQVSSGISVEHIVFDGLSSDNTVEVLRKYDGTVRWKSEEDAGQADAVNKGFKIASGDIIGWLNSDDTFEPNAIKTVVEYFEAHPGVDIVYGEANHIDVDDSHINAYPTEEWCAKRLKDVCFICQPSVFFRRSVIKEAGVLDANLQYCMDYEYWLRLAKSGKEFVKLNQILANSRLYEHNKTLGSRIKVHVEICQMFKKVYGSVPDSWLFNYAHAKLGKRTFSSHRRRVFWIAFYSIVSSLRWNKCIRFGMLGQILAWLRPSV